MQESEELLKPREVAALMRIGRDSTYSLIRSGKIPSIRIGRQIRVPRAALLRHLEREAEEAVTAPAAEEALSGA